MSDIQVNPNQLGQDQLNEIGKKLSQFIWFISQVAPKLGPHLLSGGVIKIQTMSGMTVSFGFTPQVGGIITPGGINPASNGGIIKP